MDRFLCIHGHFYQPPRENPWIEEVEIQDSAYPYHDWNERITAECYSTNGASRILDSDNRITDIVSNYANMSFDMGPTLLSWLEKHANYTYNLVLEADSLSAKWRSGHGSAIAQSYNHMIMPLAGPRDKATQTIWGIRDFRHRFKRMPEGMWLPETAVDLETLEALAANDIKFTILAPHQAARVRPVGARQWTEVGDSSIDPSRAYLCRLPSGRGISVFFYDAPISHSVAFENILDSGEHFAKRLLDGFSDLRDGPQLMHIATDGESYGHHHRFGDMALAFAMHYIENNSLARLTNYGEFLEKNPPRHEVELIENTSWSCSHGVERWKSDCGCSSSDRAGWSQKWRAPLREALDRLRDELAAAYAQAAPGLLKDPWAARDDYIDIILDRSEKKLAGFFGKHAARGLSPEERLEALRLLEIQRHSLLMYTSCGWFFDELSGIETIQILQYAGRAVQLAKEVHKRSFEKGFLRRLEAARSNIPAHGNGADIYEKFVRPSVVDLLKVGAHFAISSLYEEYPEEAGIFCYRVDTEDYGKLQSGNTSLVTGRCRVASDITGASEDIVFSVLHLGGHDFNCGVRRFTGEKSYERIVREMKSSFESGAFSNIVRLIDRHFGSHRYSLKNLFRDEQRKILETIITETLNGFEASYRSMYDENRILMGFLQETGIPVIKAFRTAAEYTLNLDLKRLLKSCEDMDKVRDIIAEFKKWDLSADAVDLEFTFRRSLIDKIERLKEHPSDISLLEDLDVSIEASTELPFKPNLWPLQNTYYLLAKSAYPQIAGKAISGDGEAGRWAALFRSVGQRLNFNLLSVLEKA